MTSRWTRIAAIAAAGAVATTMAACSSDSGTSSSSSGGSGSSSSPSMAPSSMAGSGGAKSASGPAGPACSKVPKTGKGSVKGMTTDPVATAASNNPLLSTLTTAVKKAGLVNTLNKAQGITVFAPDNDAFNKIPKAQLNKVLANKAMLTKLLEHHVVMGKVGPDQLTSKPLKTLAGDTVTVKGSSPQFKVGDNGAKVVCGNVTTANATVYVIDTVLMKKMS